MWISTLCGVSKPAKIPLYVGSEHRPPKNHYEEITTMYPDAPIIYHLVSFQSRVGSHCYLCDTDFDRNQLTISARPAYQHYPQKVVNALVVYFHVECAEEVFGAETVAQSLEVFTRVAGTLGGEAQG